MNWWAKYVGIPFGEGPGELHCWALVRRIYHDQLGVDLPEYGEISAYDLIRVARQIDVAEENGWQPITAPQAMDVCLMRSGQGGTRAVHVGVMIDAKRLLHVEAASAAVVVPVAHFSVAGRIVGYRRLQ